LVWRPGSGKIYIRTGHGFIIVESVMVGDVRPGDIVLSAVRIRAKGSYVYYYGCDVVDRVANGVPLDASGVPFTSVKAVYYRNSLQPVLPPQGRILLARAKDDPGERLRLQAELIRLFGPGELITGFPCYCKSGCMLR
jgi:hypothetical protein